MSDVISISLEETNKLRVSLGLKPIEPEIKRKPQGQEPPVKPKCTSNNETQDEVPGKLLQLELGDAKMDDTDDWLGRLSVKQPSVVVTVPSEEPVDDLKGVKIGHSVNEIANLKDGAVFTLKDSALLDDEDGEDELEEETLTEKLRVRENLKVKLGRDKQKFKGFEEDVPDDEVQGGHYVLTGNEIDTSSIRPSDASKNDSKIKKRKILILGDDAEEEDKQELEDYQSAKPVKIKKIKKFTTKHKRSKIDDSRADKELKYVELDKDLNNIVDDYELSSALSLLRKKALQKRRISPDEFVSQRVKKAVKDEEETFADGLILDETEEFLSSLKKEQTQPKIEEMEISIPIKTETQISIKSDISVSIPEVKEEKEKSVSSIEPQLDKLDEDFGSGLGSTLKMLQQRSILSKQDSHAKEIKQRQRELLKLKEILDLKKQQLSKTDVEQLKKIEREQQQLLKDYNPVVNISYHDDKGNVLSTKEAYKQLSHQFHGKAPSNNKMGKVFKNRQMENHSK